MRSRFFVLICFALAFTARATDHYVDLQSPHPAPPFTDWSSAATNIQDAIDVASEGDRVWVTNGVYAFGGKAMVSTQTNRVALDKPLTVQSVNGPFVTVIEGVGATNGPSAVRCAWLTNGAALIGFTLRRGAIQPLSGGVVILNGGGVWCASSNAFISNCIITENRASQYGGGVYQGTLANCLISSNTCAFNGGGVADAVLNNCTIIGNSPNGALETVPNGVQATNCIIYYNGGQNFSGGLYSHCCSFPEPAGAANFTNAPLLFADNVHLGVGSPCIGVGIGPVSGTDLFGKGWADVPAVGCAEFDPAPAATDPVLHLSGDPAGFTVSVSSVNGQLPLNLQWVHNGVPVKDDQHFKASQSTNLSALGVNYTDGGDYQLVVSNAVGVVTSAVSRLTIHCVDGAGTDPVVPYSTWAAAATNIQEAVDAAAQGEVVLVANGLYCTGARSVDGVSASRVVIDKPILLQSVGGPRACTIQGAWDPVSTNGPASVRCLWLTNNPFVSGFTLRGGSSSGDIITNGASANGGGIWAASTGAIVSNCHLLTNYAANMGGGVYGATLVGCLVEGNHAVGSGRPGVGYGMAGSGGGAASSYLKNCLITGNFAEQEDGGGAYYCTLIGCALTRNSSYLDGGAASFGLLAHCTVSQNISSGYTSGYGEAVYYATVSNSIIWGNFSRTSFPNTNYDRCTVSYSCTDPIAAGPGNIAVDPQLLPDGVHLGEGSPCIAAATNGMAPGVDIDGQLWNNPPSIGCDEWNPSPTIASQLDMTVNSPAHGLTLRVVAAGQSPLTCYWTHDGNPIQEGDHYRNSSTATLQVIKFGPDDAGVYAVVVSNAFGLANSDVFQIAIHVVDAAATNPVAPYLSWANAASTIQDAINSASAGDIVLVTNGVYKTGGKAIGGALTNRVALDKRVTVVSVNGYEATVIEGAWDPSSTNGPGAVRCAWIGDGAVLSGFTLRHGATLARTGFVGAPLESGGGAWCATTNATASNCVLTNNRAVYGGGFSQGILNNSLVVGNVADYGGGTFAASLVNCTVLWNYAAFSYGAGTYLSNARNSIVLRNYDGYPYGTLEDNFGRPGSLFQYSYCCTTPSLSGAGNINADPFFIDLFHLASSSICRAAGNPACSTGTDLDGEAWLNPPSIGCDEIIPTDLVGPLAVRIILYPDLLVNVRWGFSAEVTGRAATLTWDFGDGTTITNVGSTVEHVWTNTGDYLLTVTAFNTDHPEGVSTNLAVRVAALAAPQMIAPLLSSNNLLFQFAGQPVVTYFVQYATDLIPPVNWRTLQVAFSTGGVYQVADPLGTNNSRFYRLLAR